MAQYELHAILDCHAYKVIQETLETKTGNINDIYISILERESKDLYFNSLKDIREFKGRTTEIFVNLMLYGKNYFPNKQLDNGIDAFHNDDKFQIKYRSSKKFTKTDIKKLKKGNKQFPNYVVVSNVTDSNSLKELKKNGIKHVYMFDSLKNKMKLLSFVQSKMVEINNKKFYLRNYQKSAIDQLMQEKLAICAYATGLGKTIIQSVCLIENLKTSTNSINLVIMPTKTLCKNNSYSIKEKLLLHQMDVRCVIMNSDSTEYISAIDEYVPLGTPYRSTVKIPIKEENIREEIEAAKSENLPIVFLTTYKSYHKILDSLDGERINYTILDEAHNMLDSNAYKDYERLLKTSNMLHSFTATPKINDGVKSMDNSLLFGKHIIKSRKDAVDENLTIPMKVLQLKSNKIEDKTKVESSSASLVIDTCIPFFKGDGIDAYGNKMLNSKESFNAIVKFKTKYVSLTNYKSEISKKFVKDGNDIFYIDGDNLLYHNHRKISSRDEWFYLTNKSANSERDCIIFNCDVLTEGINVSGINISIDFSKSRCKATVLQCGGRQRNHKDDMDINGYLKPIEERIRKYAYYVIPCFSYSASNDEYTQTVESYFNSDVYCLGGGSEEKPKGKKSALKEYELRCNNMDAYISEIGDGYGDKLSYFNNNLPEELEDSEIEKMLGLC